jgi:hypothetical protein
MSLADRFFRKARGPGGTVELDLDLLRARFAEGSTRLAGRAVDPDLVRARLADCSRDLGLLPLLPSEGVTRTRDLDEEGWRRLALAVSGLELPAVRQALAPASAVPGFVGQVHDALIGLARELSLLTTDLLRQGPLRVEEFARQFVTRLGALVKGEAPDESRRRLQRLDYARLLAEAERAKLSAEERMEYLRKLQEEQEARRPRRGKW